MFSNNEFSIVEFDCYLHEWTVPILPSSIKKNQMSVRFYFRMLQTGDVMNEERTGKCLRQVEHVRCHLWHRYSITVNQALVANIKLSIYLRGTFGSVASLLAATLYQGNHDRNHKLWNIVSTEIYIYSICRLKSWVILYPVFQLAFIVHFLSLLLFLFFSYHVTSKSLNNIHSYHGMYLPKFIQKKILWSTPISQIEQCTTTLIK
jgi:hypothetical protein